MLYTSTRRSCVKNSGVARAFPGGRLTHPEGQNEEENDGGVARAFPVGQLAHPEGQNEEENEHSLGKNKKN